MVRLVFLKRLSEQRHSMQPDESITPGQRALRPNSSTAALSIFAALWAGWLAAPAFLYGQAVPSQSMSPEAEARARELLRQKMGELYGGETPAAARPAQAPPPHGSNPPVATRWNSPTAMPNAAHAAPASAAANQGGAPPVVQTKMPVPPPQFDEWPIPASGITPGSQETAPLGVPIVPPGMTTPQDHARGKTLYSFRAEDLDLKAALALFARGNKLNIVPDLDVTGPVTLDVQDLPLERVMQALLEANDFTWHEDDGLIRVQSTETRTFIVDYLRMTREGKGVSVVTLSSGNSSSGGGGSGGGGGMAGGGGGGGGMAGGGAGGAGGGAGSSTSGSMMNLNLENPVLFWKELEEQVRRLLTERGQNALAINMTAGVIQVTDRPSALRRVASFINQLNDSVVRQVDIEAKIYDVTLNDQFQFGIDWQHIIKSEGGNLMLGGFPTIVSPTGEFDVKPESLNVGYKNDNTTVVLKALKEQGTVSVISQPRLRTLNNQTAIMKVGRDEPFFTQFTQVVASGAAQTTTSGDQLSIITVGTVLAITPQISTNGWISLDVSPAITSLVDTITSPSGQSSAPVLDIKQTSTIVRLRDGETIIIGGLIQNANARTVRKIPVIGDVPVLGRLFTGNFHAGQKKELVIFLTPRIVR